VETGLNPVHATNQKWILPGPTYEPPVEEFKRTPTHMKIIAILLFAVLAMSNVMAIEAPNITAVIKGKPLKFSAEFRAEAIQKSVDLLSSCAFMDSHPKWGTPANPQSMADAQKDSHMRLIFSSPRKVEVPIEKITVQVREMVISLPLNSAGIWVRTDEGVLYFAKFSHSTVEKLRTLLKKVQEND
jgi:hypothetical protein